MTGNRKTPGLFSVASQVRLELVEITGALDQIARALPLLGRSRQDDLVAIAERIRRCSEILGAELDRPDTDRRFLRRAVALSSAAALSAAGFCGNVLAGEVSERIDLRSPIAIVDHSAVEIDRLDSSLGGALEDDWEVVDGDLAAWQQAIAGVNPNDLLRYQVSRFEPEGLVISLMWGRSDGDAGQQIALSYGGPMADGPEDALAEDAFMASLGVLASEDRNRAASIAVHLLRPNIDQSSVPWSTPATDPAAADATGEG